MNRMIYANSAVNSLNAARTEKMNLLQLDRGLSSLQSSIFSRRINGDNGFSLQMMQSEENNVTFRRNISIDQIAMHTYNAIASGVNALKVSLNTNNRAMIMLDDNMLYNINGFITEFYKSNEIRDSIKDKCRYSMLSFELNQIRLSRRGYFSGVNSLYSTIWL